MDLGTTFDAAVARQPNALALVDGAIRRDFTSWQDDIRRIAGGLSVMGLKRDDRLVCVMANRYEMAALYWACQMLAAVFTPFNWRATADDVTFVLRDATPRLIAFDDAAGDSVLAALEGSGISNDILISAGGGLARNQLCRSVEF